MDPADSVQISRVWTYSGAGLAALSGRIRDCHPLWSTFPSGSAPIKPTLSPVLQPRMGMPIRFGLFRCRSPLLTESMSLSSPTGTEMFQVPAFASHDYVFIMRSFGYSRIKALLTAPPDFSQFYTPFFAS